MARVVRPGILEHHSYSELAHAPSAPLDVLFPEGIALGMQPYRLIPDGTKVDLGLNMVGDRFELDACAPPCDPAFPNVN